MSTEKKAEEERAYTWSFKDGKTVKKSIEELKPEHIAALERLNNLNIAIARLSSDISDATILRDHYESIAVEAFEEEEK